MVERYGTRRGYYTSTTPIRHSRVIKRPRDLFPSESSLAARGGSIHYLRIYNYDTGESAACPKGNRPPPPPAPFNNRRSEGDRSSGSWNRTFSANPTPDRGTNHPLHPLAPLLRDRYRATTDRNGTNPRDERVFHPRCRVERGFVTPLTQASLRGVHVGVTKTNRPRI